MTCTTHRKINAMANKAQGKGYENENNYANTQFYFIGIENIHVMRDSLQKLTQCKRIANVRVGGAADELRVRVCHSVPQSVGRLVREPLLS